VGNEYLLTDHLLSGLRARAARGGLATVAAQLSRQAIGLVGTVVLARVLLPSDFGLVAMVTAVVGFVVVFREMGLSTATIQRETVTGEQVSALFWVNAGVGLLLTLLVAALAPLVAWLYREPRLLWITPAIASCFATTALAGQHRALLQRQMRFGALAVVDVVLELVQTGFGIGLALAGWGYWAIVVNVPLGHIAAAIGLWLTCRWRPSWPVKGGGVRPLLSFGGNLVGFNVASYLPRNLDKILVGRVWGEEQLGLYNKAYNLLLSPVSNINVPIAAVAVPALSRLQGSPEEYKRLYLQVVSVIALVAMPIAALMVVASEDLILVILGQRWMEAGVMLRLLGISALFQPIYHTHSWLQISLGRTDRLLRWGLISSALIIASFVVGLPFGARGVALAYSCTMVLMTWPCLWYAFRGTQIAMGDLLRAVTAAAVATLLAGGIAFCAVRWVGIHGALARLVATTLLFVLVYGAVCCLLPSSRRPMSLVVRWLWGYTWTGARGALQEPLRFPR
jgi:PST family polysaccharide transporter